MANNNSFLDGTIFGNISTSSTFLSSITGTLSPIQNIQGNLSKIISEIEGTISAPPTYSNYHFYEGTYEVIPAAELDITLNTANQILLDNITVKEIPYFETTNDSGGYTVTIS